MRNLKSVIFVLVLTTLALAPCALAKSPLLLLQEGIYAEETEGDLDKAIGLYEQVIDQAGEVERIAAKAAYKLGGCYLKKDDKTSAAKYFQSVVEKYPSQLVYINQTKEQLEKIAPAEEPQIPWNTLIYLAELHLSFTQQAETKGLYVNTHIHSIDENYNRYSGGFINFKNKTGNVIDGEVSVGNFGRTNDIKLMNELGQTQKYRYVDRNTDMGRYSVMWTPDRPIQPDESRLLGYLNSKPDKLAKTIQGYSLKMNNKFGVPVLETFFVIVPKGMEIVNQSEDYTKKITYENTDIYYWQKEVPFNTTHEVNITLNYDQAKTLDHQQKEIPLFAQVSSDVLEYLGGQYGVIAAEASLKNLKFNNHIYYVSPELKLFWGGYGCYQQPANSNTPERIRISGTTYPDQSFYDVIGNEMKVEIEDRPGQPGYYDIYWKPTVEIPAGQLFYYGWCRNKSKQLNPIANTNAYPVTMQNKFGQSVLEVFFIVLPEGFAVAEQSETFTQKETVAGFDIYQWKKEVPASTNHIVNVTLNNDHAKQAVILKDSFEKGTDTPEGWTKGNNVDGVEYIWDKNNASDGIASLCLKKTANRYFPIAQWTKEIKHQTDAQQLYVSVQVKALNTSKAILDTLFLDENGKWIKHQWVSYIGEKKEDNLPPANHDWRKYSGAVDIPENTKTIVIGPQIYGPGTVWFDDLEVAYLTTGNNPNELQAEDITSQAKQAVSLNPFNNLNQPYTIWFRPTNISVKDGKGLLELFNSIVNFDIKTYKFRTETQGQGIVGSICTDGKDGKDKIVESLNKNKEVKFIKTTTPYVISFKANDPKDAESDSGLLSTFNKCHPKNVETHHFRITPQEDQLIGHICTDTIREKNEIVTAIEKSGTMVLVGTTEPLEKQESIKPETSLEGEDKEKIEAAVKSASDWLEMIDNANYGQSWEAAASFFKGVVTQSQWEVAAKAAREPLGKFISREVVTKTYTKQVPGGPDGQYVVITFKASFENKKDAIETVTPMLDNDGKWKVSGYYIN